MTSLQRLKIGIIGSLLAALCCFTPLLVMLLGAVGLAAWIEHVDAILMPSLVFFLLWTAYAFIQRRHKEHTS